MLGLWAWRAVLNRAAAVCTDGPRAGGRLERSTFWGDKNTFVLVMVLVLLKPKNV